MSSMSTIHNIVQCSFVLYVVYWTCMCTATFTSILQELNPPLLDDFLYLCDDAYTDSELLKMERDILYTLDYDINVPVAYRFIRRLARVSNTMLGPSHTCIILYMCIHIQLVTVTTYVCTSSGMLKAVIMNHGSKGGNCLLLVHLLF